VAWVRRYILFHGKRHPLEMGGPEVSKFLTSLAVAGRAAAALSTLLFRYRNVLEQDLPWLDDIVCAERAVRLPVVLTRDEVRAVIGQLRGTQRIMALLLYGAGLRVLETARPRVKDIDFARNQIMVRTGKGNRDRAAPLPAVVIPALAAYLASVKRQHERDVERGAGWVELPWALARKCPNAGREWVWQWVFPATRFYVDPVTRQRRRHHLHESVLQRPVTEAVRRAGIPKRATCPTFRHSFATHLPGGRPRHPHRPGASRPPGPEHDPDLHARPQPGPRRRPKPPTSSTCDQTPRFSYPLARSVGYPRSGYHGQGHSKNAAGQRGGRQRFSVCDEEPRALAILHGPQGPSC
jgi:integron integrase